MYKMCRLKLLLLLAVFLVAANVSAGIYRWVDEGGQVHFGERPPADVSDSNEVVIRKQTPVAEPETVDRKQAQDRYLEQRQREKTQKKKQAATKRKREQEQERRCVYSKNRLREYLEHGALYERLPNNERRYLTDQQREREIAKSRQEVDKWCK